MSAPPSQPEQISIELAHELMSPYCPGRTLASCTSQQARKLEDYIEQQATEGHTQEEIKAELMARFGREKLGDTDNPTLVYGTAVGAIVAALLLVRLARKWVTRAPGTAVSKNVADSKRLAGATRDELDRLEDDLDRVRDF